MIVIRKHPGISNTEMIMNRQNEIYVKKKIISRRVYLSLLLATIILIIIDNSFLT